MLVRGWNGLCCVDGACGTERAREKWVVGACGFFWIGASVCGRGGLRGLEYV